MARVIPHLCPGAGGLPERTGENGDLPGDRPLSVTAPQEAGGDVETSTSWPRNNGGDIRPFRLHLGLLFAAVIHAFVPCPLQAWPDTTTERMVLIRAQDESIPDRVTVAPLCRRRQTTSRGWVRCGGEAVISRDESTGRFALLASVSAGEGVWEALVIRAESQAPLVVQRDVLLSEGVVSLVFPPASSLRICPRGEEPPVEMVGHLDGKTSSGIALADLAVGQVRIPGEDGCLEWKALPEIRGEVTLSAMGRASKALTIDLPRGEARALPVPELKVAAGTTVGVEDERHQKIGSALAIMTWAPYPSVEVQRRMESGEAAIIEIPFFDRGGAGLEVSHDCCAPWSGTYEAFSEMKHLRAVTLRRFGSLSGKVRAEEDPDLGLADVRVCAVRDAGYAEDLEESCSISGETGLFAITGLEPGGYWLRMTAGDRPRMALRDIHVEPGEDLDTGETSIPPGAEVEFLVLDAGDRSPVADATISLAEGDPEVPWSPERRATTDRDGIAVVRGLSEGDHSFRVSSPEHADRWFEARATVGKGEPEEVLLDNGGAISGKVLRRGEPGFGDLIEIRAGGRTRTSRVDEAGYYRIDGVSPGLVEVRRRSIDQLLTESRDVVVREDTTTIVDFGSGSPLHGLVMRSDVPVPGVSIALLKILSWERPTADESARIKAGEWGQAGVSKLVRSTTTDLFGEFALDGLEAGMYSISLMGERSSQTRQLKYDPDTSDELVFTLDAYVLSGIVVGRETGDRLPGTEIYASRPGDGGTSFAQSGLLNGEMVHLSTREEARTESNGRGEFLLELPGRGAWRVSAFSPGYVPSSSEIIIDSPTVQDFELGRESRLRVWVEGPDGLDSAGGRLHSAFRSKDTGRLMMMNNGLDRSGKFNLRGAAGDEVWLIASHPSYSLSAPMKTEFPASGEQDVKVELGRRGSAVLEGVSGEDHAVEGELKVFHEDSGISLMGMIPRPRVEKDDRGRMRVIFERLPSAKLVFTVGPVSRRGVVREDQTLILDFELDEDETAGTAEGNDD